MGFVYWEMGAVLELKNSFTRIQKSHKPACIWDSTDDAK